jgi:SAM-dependent methyltransferase
MSTTRSGQPDAAYYEQDELWGTEHIENAEHLQMRLDAIVELLPVETGSVLEIGTGDGRVLDHVVRARPSLTEVVGVDRSVSALRRGSFPTVAGSVDATPVRSGAADAVLCCEVLEHLPAPVFDAARHELTRLARQWIIVTVPNRENRRRQAVRCEECGCEYNPARHLRSFSRRSLETLIPEFRLISVIEAGPRVPVYPRVVRRLLEGTGVVRRPGALRCPQCDAPYRPGRLPRADRRRSLTTTDDKVRRLVPTSRRKYWLCALYERGGLASS